jgi:hypothetical protein
MRSLRTLAAVLTAVATATTTTLVGVAATSAAAPDAPPTEYTGEIEGAAYRVVVPDDWNGTLVLFSHGNYPSDIFGDEPAPHLLANQPATAEALLDRGYALGASLFQGGGLDYFPPYAVADQSRLLTWFTENVGAPERTFTYGVSMGAVPAIAHAEAEPDRIDGVLTVGAAMDPVGMFDAILDLNLATTILLTDGTDAHGNPIEIVSASDPVASRDALMAAVQGALATPEGRARLALIASLNTVTGWYDVNSARPATLDEIVEGQANWLTYAYSWGLGPTARPDIEAKLGGNPSSSYDGDRLARLQRSGAAPDVRRAYAEAGLDLRADLAALDAAPAIVADPDARAAMAADRPAGTTPSPVLTLHTTGDGGAPPSYERSFGARVARAGDPTAYRNLYVERGGHLTVTTAEELAALAALEHKVDTGRWPPLHSRALDATAWAYGPDLFGVFDPATFETSFHEPAFTGFRPPRQPRPSW